jgi:hypothetical protein
MASGIPTLGYAVYTVQDPPAQGWPTYDQWATLAGTQIPSMWEEFSTGFDYTTYTEGYVTQILTQRASWPQDAISYNRSGVLGLTSLRDTSGDLTPASIVAGTNDAFFATCIQNIANAGYTTASGYSGMIFIRMNWEQNWPSTTPGNYSSQNTGNSGWTEPSGVVYAWGTTGTPGTNNYGNGMIGAWRHAVQQLRAAAATYHVPIAICFNPVNINSYGLDGTQYGYPAYFYPGDDVVDIITTDFYTNNFYPSDYTNYPGYINQPPFTRNATQQSATTSTTSAWLAATGDYSNAAHWFDFTDSTYGDPNGSAGVGWSFAKTVDFALIRNDFVGSTNPDGSLRTGKKPIAVCETGAANNSVGYFDASGNANDLNFFSYLQTRVAAIQQAGGDFLFFVAWNGPSGTQMTDAMTATLGTAFGSGLGGPSSPYSLPTSGTLPGPLQVCPTNSRYMATPDGKAIWLHGSHIWIDFEQPTGSTLTFNEFLAWNIADTGANYMRAWHWPAKQGSWNYTIADSSLAWVRSGSGSAGDGGTLWDLTTFNTTFFSEVLTDVETAAASGVYVQICLMMSPGAFGGNEWSNFPAQWPMGSGNNINSCNPTSAIEMQQVTSGTVWNMTTLYLQKWMDTMQAQTNVIWEVTNEPEGSTTTLAWANNVAAFMHNYEVAQGYLQHPIMITSPDTSNGSFGGNADLYNSSASGATLTAPGWGNTYISNLASVGTTGNNVGNAPTAKPSIIDTDHNALNNYTSDISYASPDYIFNVLTRGYGGFVFLDILDNTSIETQASPVGGNTAGGNTIDATMQAADAATRLALKSTGVAVGLMNDLSSMTPQGSLSSTSFCLTDNATQFIVYQPSLGSAFTVTLPTGSWSYSWVDATTASVVATGTTTSTGSAVSFTPPNSNHLLLAATSTANVITSYMNFGLDTTSVGGPTVIVLTSGATWTVPSDWNSANNKIECIGGGGGGSSGANEGDGGGGGAYSASTNITLTPGASINFVIGSGGAGGLGTAGGGSGPGSAGGFTCFGGTTLASCTVGAMGGSGATGNGATIPHGGAASGGVGTIKYSGGNGGINGGPTNYYPVGAGGGAGGPHGNGATAQTSVYGSGSGGQGGAGGGGGSTGATGGTENGTAGGNNYLGSGGGAAGTTTTVAVSGGPGAGGGGGGHSTTVSNSGGAGGNGTDMGTGTVGSGGGGGGAAYAAGDGQAATGGHGGLYGGGGGAGGASDLDGGVGGSGAQGVIVIAYTPAPPSATVIVLTSGSTWTVPTDWNNLSNLIECIGGGGGGDSGNSAGSANFGDGGGGGAYAASHNLTFTPGASVNFIVGSGGTGGTGPSSPTNQGTNGGNTCFGGTTLATCSVGAQGGLGGIGDGATIPYGGAASASVGSTKYSGGQGGFGNTSPNYGRGAGGGAAGPNGNGGSGQGVTNAFGDSEGGGGSGGGSASTTQGVGGTNFAGAGGGAVGTSSTAATAGVSGGGGGAGFPTSSVNYNGASGGAGVDMASGLAGAGGGGGGAGYNATPAHTAIGGGGGRYGGGGGAGSLGTDGGTGGSGAQGVIVITYTPAGFAISITSYAILGLDASGIILRFTGVGAEGLSAANLNTQALLEAYSKHLSYHALPLDTASLFHASTTISLEFDGRIATVEAMPLGVQASVQAQLQAYADSTGHVASTSITPAPLDFTADQHASGIIPTEALREELNAESLAAEAPASTQTSAPTSPADTQASTEATKALPADSAETVLITAPAGVPVEGKAALESFAPLPSDNLGIFLNDTQAAGPLEAITTVFTRLQALAAASTDVTSLTDSSTEAQVHTTGIHPSSVEAQVHTTGIHPISTEAITNVSTRLQALTAVGTDVASLTGSLVEAITTDTSSHHAPAQANATYITTAYLVGPLEAVILHNSPTAGLADTALQEAVFFDILPLESGAMRESFEQVPVQAPASTMATSQPPVDALGPILILELFGSTPMESTREATTEMQAPADSPGSFTPDQDRILYVRLTDRLMVLVNPMRR